LQEGNADEKKLEDYSAEDKGGNIRGGEGNKGGIFLLV